MSCTGLSKEAIKGLEVQAKEVGQAYWACRACMNFSNKWHSQMREVNKRQEETEARVEANTDKIEEVRLNTEELRREFREYVQRTEGIQERLEAVMDAELREREARRLNLVIHGLQEPAENIKDSRGRMEQDKIECERLFIAMKARTRYQAIRFCRRIGERGEDPRPLVFGVFTEEEKRHLLEKAKELVYTKYEDVTVVPDMTKSQRKGEQQLRDEANKRNTQLTEEDRSKNLKWLVVGKRGEKRLIKGTERESQRGRQERERGVEATGEGWNPQIRVNTGPNRLLDRGLNSHWDNDRRSGGQSWRPEHSNNFANSNTTNGNGGPGNGGHNNGGLAGSYNNRYNSNGGPNNTSNSNSVRLGSGVSTTPTLATMEASTTIMTVAMEATIEEEMVVHQVLAAATTLATMEAPTTSMTTAMAVTTEEETVLATAATSPALTTMDSVVLTVVQVDCKVEGSGPQNWEPESEMVEPGPRTRKTPTTENWTGK